MQCSLLTSINWKLAALFVTKVKYSKYIKILYSPKLILFREVDKVYVDVWRGLYNNVTGNIKAFSVYQNILDTYTLKVIIS